MLEVIPAAISKVIAAVVDTAAKWIQDKIKARQGIARLLDLHEALIELEDASVGLVQDLRLFADEPVKTKIILKKNLRKMLDSIEEFDHRLKDVQPLMSVKSHELYRDLRRLGPSKFGLTTFSILPLVSPSLVDVDAPKVWFLARLPSRDTPITHEDLRFLADGMGHGDSNREERRKIAEKLVNRVDFEAIDPYDGVALREVLERTNGALQNLTALRIKFGQFLSDNFTLKELLSP